MTHDPADVRQAIERLPHVRRCESRSPDQQNSRCEFSEGHVGPHVFGELAWTDGSQSAPSGWQQRIAAINPWAVFGYRSHCFFCRVAQEPSTVHAADCLWQNAVVDALPPAPVYQCPECEAMVDVNFPPSASSETQEERSDHSPTREELIGYLAECYRATGSIQTLGSSDEEVAGLAVEAVLMLAERARVQSVVDVLAQIGSEVLCPTCAPVFCPHGDRLHFHHDGCPACSTEEDKAKPSPSQSAETPRSIDVRAAAIDRLIRGVVPADPPEERKDANRCAVCGWEVRERVEDGCVRGNCSMRPIPKRFYDADRAASEYGVPVAAHGGGHAFVFGQPAGEAAPRSTGEEE